MKVNRSLQGHLSAFITIFIWGTTYISTKVLLESFSPIEILFFRIVLAYLALWLIAPRRLAFTTLKEELLFMLAGLFGVTLFFTFQNTAINYTLASNVGVLIAIAPLFTAIGAYLFLKEGSLHPGFFIGFGLSFLGVFLILFNGNYVLKLNPFGDLLAILSAFVWAGYSIVTRKISERQVDTILVTRKVFFYGLIFLLPLLVLFDFQLDLTRFSSSGQSIQHVVFRLRRFSPVFCHLEFCRQSVRGGKDQRLHIPGTGDLHFDLGDRDPGEDHSPGDTGGRTDPGWFDPV